MSDQDEEIEEIIDVELFDISDTKIEYLRSRDQKKVTVQLKSETSISEMKLYLILDSEIRKLERRLGIHDPIEGENH